MRSWELAKTIIYTATIVSPPPPTPQMYKIPLQKQGILPARDIEQLFPSLEELIHFHSGFCSQLKERVAPLKDGIVTSIADLLLQRVSQPVVCLDNLSR